MTRKFKMTPVAQQALWSTLSTNENHIPTHFYVVGDAKTGYDISSVNDDDCGFTLIGLRSFYATKMFIEQVNKTGTSDFKQYCTVGSFSHSHIPIPLPKNS